MKKQDLIDEISACTGLMKHTIGDMLGGLVKVADARLKTVSDFEIPGLVKMVVKVRGERNARNPQTGEMIRVAAKNVVKATPARALREV